MTEPRIYRGQVYEPLETTPHVRRDGSETCLKWWLTRCAKCRAPFTLATPDGASQFSPSRRCKRHRQPGKRVHG